MDYLGGNQFTYLLLNPLEKLCYVEDVNVRDQVHLQNAHAQTKQAAQNIKKVARTMDFKKHEELVSQMIKKLVSGDYHTAKSAAAIVIAGVYPRMS